jgi:hypothetical protein
VKLLVPDSLNPFTVSAVKVKAPDALSGAVKLQFPAPSSGTSKGSPPFRVIRTDEPAAMADAGAAATLPLIS